jgi:hypothetical protein
VDVGDWGDRHGKGIDWRRLKYFKVFERRHHEVERDELVAAVESRCANAVKPNLGIDERHGIRLSIIRHPDLECAGRCCYVQDENVALGLLSEGANHTLYLDPLAIE